MSSSRDNSPERRPAASSIQQQPLPENQKQMEIPISLLYLLQTEERLADLFGWIVVQSPLAPLDLPLKQWHTNKYSLWKATCIVELKPGYTVNNSQNEDDNLEDATLQSLWMYGEGTGADGQFDESLQPFVNRDFVLKVSEDIHYVIAQLAKVYLVILPRLNLFNLRPDESGIYVDFNLPYRNSAKEEWSCPTRRVLYPLRQLRQQTRRDKQLAKQYADYLVTDLGTDKIRDDMFAPEQEAHGSIQDQLIQLALYCKIVNLEGLYSDFWARPVRRMFRDGEVDDVYTFLDRSYATYRW